MTCARIVLVVAALMLGPAAPGSAQPVIGAPVGDEGEPDASRPAPSSGIALREPMWVAVQGQTTGPFEPPEIAQKIVTGEIVAETLVYTGSMSRWLPAGEVAALQPLLRQAAERGGRERAGRPERSRQGDGEQQAARLAEYMLGEWEFDWPFMESGRTARAYIRYRPDGTFRGYITERQAPKDGGPAIPITYFRSGTWAARAVDDRRFVLSIAFVAKDQGGEKIADDLPYEILDPNRKRHEESKGIAVRVARY